MEEAATPTGAEDSARADDSAPSRPLTITERLKAAMAPPTEANDAREPSEEAPERAEPKPKKVEAKKEIETADDEPAEVETEEDAPTELQLSTLNDLAESTGLELEKLMDLDIPTKIDGKEGTARLRDLIKSHQLEGHLNQKLMTHAEEKKAFEAEILNRRNEQQQKFMQLNAAAQVASRLLEGDMAGTDWQALEQADPLEFNQKVVKFQRRQADIQKITQQIAQERAHAEQEMAQQKQAYLTEQAKLLDSKLPEWSDRAARTKAIAEMVPVMSEAYGITEKELKNETDHRMILVARDAVKWQQLQKAKPNILNKVKVAPRLLKPGVIQSKAAQDGLALKGDRERLRQSGKVRDATAVLKRLIF